MAETSIEWADRVWNFLAGCSLASPGCTNCYAQRQAARIERMNPGLDHYQGLTRPSKAGPVWTGKIGFAEHKLTEPLRVRKPARWFVNSMSDLFHEDVPDEVIDRAFAVMALAPQHVFQVLTKRSKRMRDYITEMTRGQRSISVAAHKIKHGDDPATHVDLIDVWSKPISNVWLGVSVEDQKRADERIPDLLATPAAIRWISAEPLLGPLYLDDMNNGHKLIDTLRGNWWHDDPDGPNPISRGHEKLDWVVVGGESGPSARPMHPDWARSLRDQCASAGVPFFFKQWGEWITAISAAPAASGRYAHPHRRRVHGGLLDGQCFEGSPKDHHILRVGKKAAGRLLDGVEHNGMPDAARRAA